MTKETRPCDYCGTATTKYLSKHGGRPMWTCSRSCAASLRHRRDDFPTYQANRFRGQRESRPCAVCGTPSPLRYVTERNHDQPWYCSRDCGRTTARAAHVRQGNETPCGVCGTPVYRPQGKLRALVYCSPACANIGKRAPRTERPCATCGQPMTLRPSGQARRYCSLACSQQGRFKNTLPRLHNGKPVRYDHLGYVLVWQPGHPNAKPNGWILEHRLVMSNAKGRALESTEEVDHINGVRDQNGLDNLQLFSRAAHRSKTGDDRRKAKVRLSERLVAAEAQVAALRAQLAALNEAADAERSPD